MNVILFGIGFISLVVGMFVNKPNLAVIGTICFCTSIILSELEGKK